MTRVLVVEDKPLWQSIQKSGLEHLLGEGSVDIADNYDAALSMLTPSYAAYVVDGEFPKSQGGSPEQIGIRFAREIYQRENSYDKVFFISGNPDVCEEHKMQGYLRFIQKV